MKKHILLLATACLWLSNAMAQELEPCAIMELKSGGNVMFLLSDNPTFWYNDDKVIFTNGRTTVEYEAKQIAKFYTGQGTDTGIANVAASGKDIQITEESIRLIGFAPNEQVHVYSAAGHEYLVLYTSASGNLTIACSDIANGINIVKTQNQSFKVIRK